ncbi:GGDEF domain-containing protein [Aeromicrobium wangtongii]|uniref:Diguanylate cyclase n=1 Tax=Aeromicrobium wangtongii TaxID=2969247 RepID=A0ABY5MAY4_9ACTN|nr:GGDEF domain-containing protein [Aeromicrobium wangtongii]MCD9197804.1 diguanylate cyclase [Aeromicrobium wangtongii]UUP15285.1 diguanylate cyclase [Aeromicrobium wangtongii]
MTDFEAVFRGASTGFVITAADGTIVDVNDWFATWTGLGREDLLGTSFLRLLPVGDRIVFSTRTAPLLDLAGRVPEIAVTVLGADRVRLPATLGASRVMTDPDVTLYVVVPRRERSFEEMQLISAVHRAEEADARRRSAEEDLERVARHDTLTGLLNRTGMVAALAERFTDLPPGQELGACWIGLDHFRVVVESLGRPAGDDVLKTIARRLGDRFGEGALVGRVGGDKFVVVLREEPLEDHADSILALVAEPMMADDLEIVVSASIGLATGQRVTFPGRAGPARPQPPKPSCSTQAPACTPPRRLVETGGSVRRSSMTSPGSTRSDCSARSVRPSPATSFAWSINPSWISARARSTALRRSSDGTTRIAEPSRRQDSSRWRRRAG